MIISCFGMTMSLNFLGCFMYKKSTAYFFLLSFMVSFLTDGAYPDDLQRVKTSKLFLGVFGQTCFLARDLQEEDFNSSVVFAQQGTRCVVLRNLEDLNRLCAQKSRRNIWVIRTGQETNRLILRSS